MICGTNKKAAESLFKRKRRPPVGYQTIIETIAPFLFCRSLATLTCNVPGANICTSDYGPMPTFFLIEGFFRTLNTSPPTPSRKSFRLIFRMICSRMICFFWHHRHYVNTPPWWQICWCWCPNSSTRPLRFSFLLSCPWLFLFEN